MAILLTTVGTTAAQPIVPVARIGDDIAPKIETNPLPKLNLGQCLSIAYEKQPKLAALRASVSSAEAGQRGLESARLLGALSADFKFRRQQASTGVCAATAELEQATHDVTQAVVWTYYSVVYAKEQVKVAREAVEFVDYYRNLVDKIVNAKEGGNKEINKITLNRMVSRLAGGELLLIKAQSGVERSQAALREAMGVDYNYIFEPADEELPDFAKIAMKRESIIDLAQERRGEVTMASLASDVTRLEAYSQWSVRFRFRVQTFAAGGDIHARTIPSGSKDGDYRPDAIGPEMPTMMVGNRQTRSERAWALATRSEAVLEKTKNLVALEAENAYIEYHYAGLSMEKAKKQADSANSNLMTLKEVAGDQVTTATALQQLLEAQEEAAKGQAAYNEAVYQRISALANIERITAGGIRVNYPGR